MEEQKKVVTIDITKHERKFIDFSGKEITRQEALGGQAKAATGEQKVTGSESEGE